MRPVPMVLRRYVFTRLIVQKRPLLLSMLACRAEREDIASVVLMCPRRQTLRSHRNAKAVWQRSRNASTVAIMFLACIDVGGVYNGEIKPVRLAISVYSSRDDGLDASLDLLLLPGHVRRTIIT
ncbi:hypothetical protein DPMN_072460 [Dreissena polymorpha]|uniref:Uncharacterized protein n=1 Tax=Dreissena polymorpha TaxID=45954 RepID=A0A9D3Z8K4_DREPO|nr:hypothetical protein DPMN_072460 [Dreissena polymorpha]